MQLQSLLLLSATIFGLASASPAPQAATPTVTISNCPIPGKCKTICPTPTATVEPENCKFDLNACPVARCMFIPPVVSTSTRICKAGSGCNALPTANCDKIPSATLTPPCPTACPELCPLQTSTVVIACPTTIVL